MILSCIYGIGEKVHIDEDKSITGIVTCIEIRKKDVIRYEVSWIQSGDAKFIVFDEWRLTAA